MTGAATSAAAAALQRYGKPDNNKLIAYRARPIAGLTTKLLTCELRVWRNRSRRPRTAAAAGRTLTRAPQRGLFLSGIAGDGIYPGATVHDEIDAVQSYQGPSCPAARPPPVPLPLWSDSGTTPKLRAVLLAKASCPHHPGF